MLSGIRQASSRQLMNARSATIAIGAQRRWLLIKNVDDVRKAGNIKMIGENVCESRRYLLRKDGFGFSLHYTILFKGERMFIKYDNHLEAAIVVKGRGHIQLASNKSDTNGERHELGPGTFYALNKHDGHWAMADKGEDIHFVCVFVPPCDGSEVHNSDGVYPYIGADGRANYTYWADKQRAKEKITLQVEAGYGNDADNSKV